MRHSPVSDTFEYDGMCYESIPSDFISNNSPPPPPPAINFSRSTKDHDDISFYPRMHNISSSGSLIDPTLLPLQRVTKYVQEDHGSPLHIPTLRRQSLTDHQRRPPTCLLVRDPTNTQTSLSHSTSQNDLSHSIHDERYHDHRVPLDIPILNQSPVYSYAVRRATPNIRELSPEVDLTSFKQRKELLACNNSPLLQPTFPSAGVPYGTIPRTLLPACKNNPVNSIENKLSPASEYVPFPIRHTSEECVSARTNLNAMKFDRTSHTKCDSNIVSPILRQMLSPNSPLDVSRKRGSAFGDHSERTTSRGMDPLTSLPEDHTLSDAANHYVNELRRIYTNIMPNTLLTTRTPVESSHKSAFSSVISPVPLRNESTFPVQNRNLQFLSNMTRSPNEANDNDTLEASHRELELFFLHRQLDKEFREGSFKNVSGAVDVTNGTISHNNSSNEYVTKSRPSHHFQPETENYLLQRLSQIDKLSSGRSMSTTCPQTRDLVHFNVSKPSNRATSNSKHDVMTINTGVANNGNALKRKRDLSTSIVGKPDFEVLYKCKDDLDTSNIGKPDYGKRKLDLDTSSVGKVDYETVCKRKRDLSTSIVCKPDYEVVYKYKDDLDTSNIGKPDYGKRKRDLDTSNVGKVDYETVCKRKRDLDASTIGKPDFEEAYERKGDLDTSNIGTPDYDKCKCDLGSSYIGKPDLETACKCNLDASNSGKPCNKAATKPNHNLGSSSNGTQKLNSLMSSKCCTTIQVEAQPTHSKDRTIDCHDTRVFQSMESVCSKSNHTSKLSTRTGKKQHYIKATCSSRSRTEYTTSQQGDSNVSISQNSHKNSYSNLSETKSSRCDRNDGNSNAAQHWCCKLSKSHSHSQENKHPQNGSILKSLLLRVNEKSANDPSSLPLITKTPSIDGNKCFDQRNHPPLTTREQKSSTSTSVTLSDLFDYQRAAADISIEQGKDEQHHSNGHKHDKGSLNDTPQTQSKGSQHITDIKPMKTRNTTLIEKKCKVVMNDINSKIAENSECHAIRCSETNMRSRSFQDVFIDSLANH